MNNVAGQSKYVVGGGHDFFSCWNSFLQGYLIYFLPMKLAGIEYYESLLDGNCNSTSNMKNTLTRDNLVSEFIATLNQVQFLIQNTVNFNILLVKVDQHLPLLLQFLESVGALDFEHLNMGSLDVLCKLCLDLHKSTEYLRIFADDAQELIKCVTNVYRIAELAYIDSLHKSDIAQSDLVHLYRKIIYRTVDFKSMDLLQIVLAKIRQQCAGEYFSSVLVSLRALQQSCSNLRIIRFINDFQNSKLSFHDYR
jgi:hypothetical protein